MSWLFKISKFELILGSILNSIEFLTNELEKKDKLDEVTQRKILLYERKAHEWKTTSRRYSYIIIFMYIALYCSVTSVFFNQLLIIDELLSFISKIVSLTGTTIFIISLAAAQYIRDIHYQKLLLLQSQINLMCSLNNIEPDFILTLEDEEVNEYENMLKLLRKDFKKTRKNKK